MITNMQNNMKITTIDLSGRNLDEIPYDVIDFDTNWIILSDNRLKKLDWKISTIKMMTRLALNDNNISEISPEIGECENLSWIDLTRNNLTELPSEFARLVNISGLGLSENNFQEIPQSIFSLVNLRKFGFFSNSIKFISPDIRYLRNLVKIDLSNNCIEEIPKELMELKKLSWLNLSNNKIRKIPKEINNLYKLEELGLGMNEIEEIPCVDNLKNLRIFPVFKNKLRKIHNSVFQLPSIEKLDFSDNLLEEFPLESIRAPKLKYLNLRSNRIQKISTRNVCNGVFSKLTMIDLSFNLLKYLPFSLFKMLSHQANVRLNNNPYTLMDIKKPETISLTRICVSKLLKGNLKIQKWVPAKYQSEKYYCDNCRSEFVVEPYYFYLESYFDPDNRFVIEKTICSKKCIYNDVEK